MEYNKQEVSYRDGIITHRFFKSTKILGFTIFILLRKGDKKDYKYKVVSRFYNSHYYGILMKIKYKK